MPLSSLADSDPAGNGLARSFQECRLPLGRCQRFPGKRARDKQLKWMTDSHSWTEPI